MNKLILFIACSSLFLSAYAQEDTVVKSLNEVIVTANRTMQKEAVVPYTVQSVDRKHLNQFNPRTTPEALMGMNGVFVQKTNHGGGSAFVR